MATARRCCSATTESLDALIALLGAILKGPETATCPTRSGCLTLPITQAVQDIPGAEIEDNVYSISVHYRNCPRSEVPHVSEIVQRIKVRQTPSDTYVCACVHAGVQNVGTCWCTHHRGLWMLDSSSLHAQRTFACCHCDKQILHRSYAKYNVASGSTCDAACQTLHAAVICLMAWVSSHAKRFASHLPHLFGFCPFGALLLPQGSQTGLRLRNGKEVYELQPDINWNKGR
jgi:Trehalose-phosphatase